MEHSDEFLLGDDLLVAPIYNLEACERSIYLPDGAKWVHVFSGTEYNDGQEIELNYVYVFTVKGAVGILSEWIKNDFSYSAEKIADIITEMHHAALNQLKIMQEKRQ